MFNLSKKFRTLDHKVVYYMLVFWLLIVSATYLLQVISPLRINNDSYQLLLMAVSSYNGDGYIGDGNATFLAIGYPYIVKVLLQVGLANSKVLVALNLLSLSVGICVLKTWMSSRWTTHQTLLAMLFVLSSWVMVKHVTIPISDLVYVGFSVLSILFICLFYKREGLGKWLWFIFSVIFCYLSLMCRTVGLSILPVIFATTLLHREHSQSIIRFINNGKNLIFLLLAIVILIIVSFNFVLKTQWFELHNLNSDSYLYYLVSSYRDLGILAFFTKNIQFRILEFGQIFSNIPLSKMKRILPIIFAVGLLAWAVSIRGALLLFRTNLLPLSLYFFSYTFMMLLWPYDDTRFWLPMLPILAVLFLSTISKLGRNARFVCLNVKFWML